jgi:hypothetical protein
MADMDTMGFNEFKSYLRGTTDLNVIKKFSEKYMEYYKFKQGFIRLRTEGIRSTPPIDVVDYLDELLTIAEKRKEGLNKTAIKKKQRLDKEKIMWANLDKIAVKKEKKGCNDFNSCACELKKAAQRLSYSLGVPGKNGAILLLRQAIKPCPETGALRKSKKLTQRMKKSLKSSSKPRKTKKSKAKKKKRSSNKRSSKTRR